MERWPADIPTSVCTLGVTREQSRAHCAAALMYMMRMAPLKQSMRYVPNAIRADGGRAVWKDNTYSGFRMFEIARIEQVALQLNEDMMDAIEAQADLVCKANQKRMDNDKSGQT